MGHYIATDRNQGFSSWTSGKVGVHLVGDDHSHTKFVGKASKHAQESAKMFLTGEQLFAANVFGSVECSCTVDDQKGNPNGSKECRLSQCTLGNSLAHVPGFGHNLGGINQKLGLVVGVVSSCKYNILQSCLMVEPVAVCHGDESLRAEGTFGINVDALALGASIISGQLTGDGEHVGQLGLAGAVFAIDFSYRTSFYAT